MLRKFPIVVIFLVALAVNSVAQGPVALKLNASSDGFDPLGILESEEGEVEVKKPVVVRRASNAVVIADVERQVFELVNKERSGYGLAPLMWCDELVPVARVHSQNMAEFQFFSHRGLDDKMVSDRADAHRLGRWRAIGENIAFNRGYKDPVERAVQQWLGSPSHRRNMLDADWKESAVGIAVAADGSYYFTHVLLKRK